MCDPERGTETDSTRACCDTETRTSNGERTEERWLGGSGALGAELPPDLQASLARFFGEDAVETLGDWATAVRDLMGGETVAVEHLCHADGETDHWGEVGGERYYFRCFYDAVVLAVIEERPVDIRTASPGGAVIEARADSGDGLSVSPQAAALSLGIAEAAGERSGGDPTPEDGYAAICPYVRAFPDRDAYERWAEDVPAPTAALSLAGGTEFAAALVA